MKAGEHPYLIVTGLAGLAAALLVGVGEFLLHFDPLARFSESPYAFMLAADDQRQSIGHFFASFGAPLYVLGCAHIYLMLKPANQKLALITALVAAYGFIIGAQWISSRASIGAIIHLQQQGMALDNLVELYQFRYENLLSVIRVTTLSLSVVFIALALSGRSHYQKWHALFNPITLLLACFALFVLYQDLGKYLMPIALNVAFGVFYLLSTIQAYKITQSGVKP
ncbi:MAG: hypothetical protein ACI8WB_001991 [Phenylobacterium sp.]|jgi:hypothetical protein